MRSFNAIGGDEGQERYEQDGKPLIPSIVLDGEVHTFQHPGQIAELLGIEVEGVRSAGALAWSLLDVLQRYLDLVRDLDFEQMRLPTESRARDIRNLVVNVFRPIAYLAQSWEDGEFNWFTGEADTQQETFLRNAKDVLAFAEEILIAFNSFVLDAEAALDAEERRVDGNRGDMTYATLLTTQRFHVAFHYRQIVDCLSKADVAEKPSLPDALLREIALPEQLY